MAWDYIAAALPIVGILTWPPIRKRWRKTKPWMDHAVAGGILLGVFFSIGAAAKAHDDATQAEKKLDNANARLEDERNKNRELEKLTKPRRLLDQTPPPPDVLARMLAHPIDRISFEGRKGCANCGLLAGDVKGALMSFHVNTETDNASVAEVEYSNRQRDAAHPPIFLIGTPKDLDVMQAIADWLDLRGLHAVASTDDRRGGNIVSIWPDR